MVTNVNQTEKTMKHSSFLSLLITSLVVIALTLLYACEDNLSVQDTPPPAG